MVEVRRQAEEDRLRYAEQVHFREDEIERLRPVQQQLEQNALVSQNAASLAETELARAHALTATASPRAATPTQFVGGPQLPPNESPLREVDPSNPAGEGPGYDRVEDVMREEFEREGCTPPKQRRHGEQWS